MSGDLLERTSHDLDLTFAALADPTRRAIVDRLALGEATVLELASPFDISLPAISRHLKVLEQAGLIERTRRGRERPCTLRPEAVAAVSRWADHTRRAWERRLDRLDAFLTTTPAPEAPDGADGAESAPEPQETDQ